jgi:F-box interacting protein
MHGFGYDSRSNDYKVLRVATLVDDHLTRLATVVQVYSLARGSWRSLSASDVPIDLHGDCNIPAFVNGILHTLEARVYYHDNAEEHRTHDHDRVYYNFIASFNLATEVFGEIMIPETLQKDICSISRYGDSLALINYDCDSRDMVNYGCDIWVMEEYGVAESWTFLYNIVMFEVTIYGFKRCGEVMLKETDLHGEPRMVSLDPKSKQVKDLGTKDYIYHYMDSFVESLVLLDHANAISYQGEIK